MLARTGKPMDIAELTGLSRWGLGVLVVLLFTWTGRSELGRGSEPRSKRRLLGANTVV